MGLSAKNLAGPGYVILNTLRVLNIIGLFAVVAASIVMLVKTVIDSNFFFFDAVSHVITASISLFLIISELSLFRKYFTRNWPLLSPDHGFVALGLAMVVLGTNLLGNLNKPATSVKSLGLPCWRIMIAAGCLIMIFGVFNVIASYVFRDKNLGITARQVRAKGAVAHVEQNEAKNQKAYSFTSSTRTGTANGSQLRPDNTGSTKLSSNVTAAPMTQYTPPQRPSTPPPDTEQNRKSRTSRWFGRYRPTLPSYHTSPVMRSPSSKYSERPPIREISAPMGVNPQFAHLVRPDSAYHVSPQNHWI